jgi:hypothetical protein
VFADDPGAAQGREFLIRDSRATQDLVVVLAQGRRSEAMVASRSGSDAERPAGIAVWAGDRMLELLVVSTRSGVMTFSTGTPRSSRATTIFAGDWV